jgi:magnesium-protoporphyrin O-methyltransferase
VDLSPTLVGLAKQRAADVPEASRITFRVGDMLSPDFGTFDHAVAMDSLIHYRAEDVARALSALAPRVRTSIAFTFAPLDARTRRDARRRPPLPRAAIAHPPSSPVREAALRRRLAAEPALAAFRAGADARISRGFYISHALELRRLESRP